LSLEDTYFISQIIAAISIVASLLFVGVQLRQADQTRRVELIHARASRYMGHIMAEADADNARVWTRGMAGDPQMAYSEFHQFLSLYSARMLGFEAIYLEHEARAIDADAFEPQMSAVRQLFGSSSGRAMWKIVKPTFHRRFVAWTETEFPASQGILRGGYEGWKRAVAEGATLEPGGAPPVIDGMEV